MLGLVTTLCREVTAVVTSLWCESYNHYMAAAENNSYQI